MGKIRMPRLHPGALIASVIAATLWLVLWLHLLEPPVRTQSMEAPVYYEDSVIVLMYHHIDEAESSSAVISPDKFTDHMRMLREQGYAVISMAQFTAFMEGQAEVPDNAVLLTFDDGYESFYHQAYPVLAEYGYSASHFIVVKTTDVFNPDALPHLSWEQMREMKASGMQFYNHTYDLHMMVATDSSGTVTKPALTTPRYIEASGDSETREDYLARVEADLRLANERLDEELGVQEKLLAFPYGAYNRDVLEIGDRLGFRLYFTTQPGLNYSGARTVFRVNAGSPDITAERLLEIMRGVHDSATAVADE